MALDQQRWEEDLERWLAPFLAHLSHRARQTMYPLYVAGLIGPGDRKSIQPMAERLGLSTHDRLHHFVFSGAWDAAPLEAELLVQADQLVGGPGAYFVIDDTALPCPQGDAQHQEGHLLGRGDSSICLGARQERQLPDACLAHLGPG